MLFEPACTTLQQYSICVCVHMCWSRGEGEDLSVAVAEQITRALSCILSLNLSEGRAYPVTADCQKYSKSMTTISPYTHTHKHTHIINNAVQRTVYA